MRKREVSVIPAEAGIHCVTKTLRLTSTPFTPLPPSLRGAALLTKVKLYTYTATWQSRTAQGELFPLPQIDASCIPLYRVPKEQSELGGCGGVADRPGWW
jgi:hypothetical protein